MMLCQRMKKVILMSNVLFDFLKLRELIMSRQSRLKLTRKAGESIVIGEDKLIVVEVVKIQGNYVKLSIEAPIEMLVHRLEVYEMTEVEEKDSDNFMEETSTDY